MFGKNKPENIEKNIDNMEIGTFIPDSGSEKPVSVIDKKIRDTIKRIEYIKGQLYNLEMKSKQYVARLEKLDKIRRGKSKIDVIKLLDILDAMKDKYNDMDNIDIIQIIEDELFNLIE